jgi:Sec7-like guanine-nucleotide exchange factor
VWTLSIKLIDLNTNLHNPNVKPMLRYSRETFVEQSMRIPEISTAFAEEQVSEMYDRIANDKFENKVTLHERYFKRMNELSYILLQKHSAATSQQGASQKLKKSALVTRFIEEELKQKHELFKEIGTVFTKYGRMGEPKQRVVWLDDDETKILWRGRYKNEEPRAMAIGELVDV